MIDMRHETADMAATMLHPHWHSCWIRKLDVGRLFKIFSKKGEFGDYKDWRWCEKNFESFSGRLISEPMIVRHLTNLTKNPTSYLVEPVLADFSVSNPN